MLGSNLPARVRMRLKVQLAPSPIGYVRVELRRRQVGVSKHFLNGPEVGAALEEMRRERVAQEVRVHALRLEARLLGEPAKDEERARTGELAAACVEEELGAVALVEIRAAVGEV